MIFLMKSRAFWHSIDSNTTETFYGRFIVLSWMAVETDTEEKKSLNKVVIFVFFAHKKKFS